MTLAFCTLKQTTDNQENESKMAYGGPDLCQFDLSKDFYEKYAPRRDKVMRLRNCNDEFY